jgi:solute carrier family 25 protein 16
MIRIILITSTQQAKSVVAPLDRVKILFQTSNPQFQKYSGSWNGFAIALRSIYSQDGTRGLFRGHSATLLRIFPYAGIKFLAYEQVRAVLVPDHAHETALRRFASGSLAGMCSVLFTYPLEVIRVRLAFETRQDKRSTLREICTKIYNERPGRPQGQVQLNTASLSDAAASGAEVASAAIASTAPRYGLINFYRGFIPTMCGMVPYAGASFLAHDTASDFLRHPSFAEHTIIPNTAGQAKSDPNKPAQLKVWAQLTAGGFAGFFAQTVSYPLEVIRRRMQVGGVVGDGHRLGMAETTKRIIMEKGYRGFFVGLSIGYMKIIPLSATSFFVYERAKFYFGI